MPSERVDAEVDALVARLAWLSGSAMREMEGLYRMAMTTDPALAMAAERETLLRHLSEDPGAAEGLAAFTERRAPDFGGARV